MSKFLWQIQNIKSYEAELKQLRGLSNDQHESIQGMRKQVEEVKAELTTATQKLQEEIDNCQALKQRHSW